MTNPPDATLKVLAETDAKLAALGLELGGWVSSLRNQLAALPSERPRAPSRSAEAANPLAAALSDLDAVVVELRGVLKARP